MESIKYFWILNFNSTKNIYDDLNLNFRWQLKFFNSKSEFLQLFTSETIKRLSKYKKSTMSVCVTKKSNHQAGKKQYVRESERDELNE